MAAIIIGFKMNEIKSIKKNAPETLENKDSF